MILFSTSDVHGEYQLLKEMIEANVDFPNGDKLILNGDYVDGRISTSNSYLTLDYIYNLQQQYPTQVIVLLGNHDLWLWTWLLDKKCELRTFELPGIETLFDFLTKEQEMEIMYHISMSDCRRISENIEYTYKVCKKMILKNHRELLNWLQQLPTYYETSNQIFVHAGVNIIEGCEEYWKESSTLDDLLMQYPPNLKEYTHKTIIAGHVGTRNITNDINFSNCYRYGNKIYIDSTVKESKRLNLLRFDESTNRYSEMIQDENKKWVEIDIYCEK